jgi:hypothetical protein
VRRGDGIWVLIFLALVVAAKVDAGAADQPAKPQARPRATTTTEPPSARPPVGLSFTDAAGCRPSADYTAPKLDRRVRALLAAVATHHRVRVSCLRTGHSWFVAGTTRVSNHSVWRAVDVDQVDRAPVSPANTAARELARWIGQGGAGVQPSEVGSPWDSGPGSPTTPTSTTSTSASPAPPKAGGGR